MNDSISLIIPTAGRHELHRAIRSVVHQLRACDELLVIGDVTDGPLPDSEAIVREFDMPQVRYVPLEGTTEHTWGHDQLNHGLKLAQGAWLHGNDDDDVWSPDALHEFRKAIAEFGETAMLFRFISKVSRLIFWLERGVYGRDRIGGHCLLQPNVPGKIGYMAAPYNGDFDYVDGAVQAWGGPDNVPWLDRIIAIARPDPNW